MSQNRPNILIMDTTKLDSRYLLLTGGTLSGNFGLPVNATIQFGVSGTNTTIKEITSAPARTQIWGLGSRVDILTAAGTAYGTMTCETIYGNNNASKHLYLESTRDATKGYVVLQPNGGNVGIGTAAPGGRLDIHGTGTTTGAALQIADSSGATKVTVWDNGKVGIGTIPTAYSQLEVSPVIVDHASSEFYVLDMYPFWRPTADVAKSFIGAVCSVNVDNVGVPAGNLTGTYTGGVFSLYNRLDSPIAMSNAVGGNFKVYNGIGTHSGVITNARAGQFSLQNDSTSSMTTAQGCLISSPTGTGTIATLYGLKIEAQAVGTSNNYAIHTRSGNIVFNEDGDANTDLRVEGDTDANLLFVDASADKVGIGTNAPTAKLSVSEKCAMNADGGFMVKLTNKTGANTVKGTIVKADTAVDQAFILNVTSGDQPIGVVYESGIADGAEAWVVVQGKVQVLLADTTASTRGYWATTSATAGRADITNAAPVPATHWNEIGHCIEDKIAGTNVLAWIILHFN